MLPAEIVAKYPTFEHDSIALICGDCLEILPGLPAGSVDAVVTDPPYGTGYYDTDININPIIYKSWVAIYATVAIFGYPELLVKQCVQSGIIPDEWITWNPSNKFMSKTRGLPKESECVAIFGSIPGVNKLYKKRINNSFGKSAAIRRKLNPLLARLGDVWNDPSPGMAFNYYLRLHPNEKPVSLMDKLIILCSEKSKTILDPFMGSGTTGVACVQTGRRFIGIEISREYFDIAVKRIKQAQLQIRMDI